MADSSTDKAQSRYTKTPPLSKFSKAVRRVWPSTLFARLILLMLLTLLAVQILSVTIYLRDRDEVIDSASDRHTRQQITALIRLMDQARPQQYRTIIKATRNDELSLAITSTPLVDHPSRVGRAGVLEDRLMRQTGRAPAQPIHISLDAVEEHCEDEEDHDQWRESEHPEHEDKHRFRHHGEHPRPGIIGKSLRKYDEEKSHYHSQMTWSVTVSARLKTGRWLNIRVGHHDDVQHWDWHAARGLLLIGILVIGVMIWQIKSNTRPLRRLANTAEQIGRGQEPTPLAEEGAEEVRSTIRAFNTMQEKQQRFIKDRVLMLAAISHDLKTPLTKLRLQSEFIDDSELQQQQQRTLSDMENMLNATMAFARDDDQSEPSSDIDLASLISSLCDDHIAGGANLSTQLPDRLVYHCRPTGIRRLFSNLIDNAVKYAPSAHIGLFAKREMIEFIITDTGPGIPDELLDQVFRPFFRVESSRNRATGGMGLGLSVVRSTALLHGGEVVLENTKPNGLQVIVRLPCKPN